MRNKQYDPVVVSLTIVHLLQRVKIEPLADDFLPLQSFLFLPDDHIYLR